jgi:hypothetical protein
MNQTKEVWPGQKPPTKEEIERLYRLSYMVDHEFFRREDVIDLGLDLRRLKEFGEVRMSKTLGVIRKYAPGLWKRMNDLQKAAYIMADVISGLKYVDQAIKELEKVVGPIPEAHDGVSFVHTGLFSRIPSHLRVRLEKGFGKWKANGSSYEGREGEAKSGDGGGAR